MLRVAARVPATRVEGPYLRYALWVQGCTLRCPGCCNPEMFAARGGEHLAIAAVVDEIEAATREHAIEGITLLGGEPLQQLSAVAELCRQASALGLGTLVFTGYRFAEARVLPGFADLWRSVDTLVTGRYDAARPEPADGRRVLGSTNQRLRHRTPRYADASLWSGAPAAEVHVAPDGGLRLVGAPQTIARLVHALRPA